MKYLNLFLGRMTQFFAKNPTNYPTIIAKVYQVDAFHNALLQVLIKKGVLTQEEFNNAADEWMKLLDKGIIGGEAKEYGSEPDQK